MPDDAPRPRLPADLDRRGVALSIADAIRDLVPLARRAGYRDLGYLLDLALAEALHLAGPSDERGGDRRTGGGPASSRQ